MKIAFISDIHGNARSLDRVLAHLAGKSVDRIVVLGDLCYRGPEPKRALDLIRSLKADVIKGNADEWVVRGVGQGEAPDAALEMMNRERDWTAARLDAEDMAYLQALPKELTIRCSGGRTIFAFHATPDSLFEIVPPAAEDEVIQARLMGAAEADLYVYAHIHKPYCRSVGGRIIVNTGSVGLPFDRIPMASYAIAAIGDDGGVTVSIERVKVDVEGTAEQYRQVGYPNADMMADVVRRAGPPVSRT